MLTTTCKKKPEIYFISWRFFTPYQRCGHIETYKLGPSLKYFGIGLL